MREDALVARKNESWRNVAELAQRSKAGSHESHPKIYGVTPTTIEKACSKSFD